MQKLDFPNRITVEVTNDCNISCTFCNRQKIIMDTGYMSRELFYKIIDEAAEHLPVKLVPFFRGEPLMHPHIADFVKYAKEKGMGPVQMASNALLLDEQMQDALLDAGVDFMSFSLDTTDEEVYRCSRIRGSLEKSSRNVETFGMKCRERKNKGLKAPVLQVSTIDMDEYRKDQDAFIQKWKKYADIVRVYEQHDEKGRFVNPKVREKTDIFETRMPCRKVFTDMIIYWDGRLALCNYDWNEERDIGNISEMSIQEAWNSAVYEEIRNAHLNSGEPDGICRECEHWKIDYVDGGFLGKSYSA